MMVDMAQMRNPLVWWAENGHISKSIGPFLYKRMQERNVYFKVDEVTPTADKETRAQAIAARMALGYLWFPKDTPWAEKGIEELMKFPNGTHDDFVDALSLMGLGMRDMHAPSGNPTQVKKAPKYGTLAWVKQHDVRTVRQAALSERGGF